MRIIGIVAVLLLSACSTEVSETPHAAGPPATGGRLTFAVDSEDACLDPHVSPADIVGELQRNVFDSLVARAQDGSFVPWLATSWQIADGGREYTFALRHDVKFFDGTAFTAAAVQANLDHIVAPATKSQYAASLLGPYAGTDLIDDYTVRIRFTAPYAPFLQAASTSYLGMYAPAVLAEHPDKLCGGGRFAVGSGPFREVEVRRGQGITFVRNEAYDWAPATARHTGRAYLDQIEVRYLTEDAVRTGALRGGGVDLIARTPPVDVADLGRDRKYQLLRRDSPGVPYSLFFNQSRPPFSDIRARQAVVAALDLTGMIDSIYFGEYARAYEPLSPTTPGAGGCADARSGFALATANRLLDELGYLGRDAKGYRIRDGRRFTIAFPWASNAERESRELISQAVQEDLKKVGVEVRLEPVDYGTHLTRVYAGDYDLIGVSWARADPDILATLYQSDRLPAQGGANVGGVHDPQLDLLLAQGRSSTDAAQRLGIYRQAQQRILNQAYSLPVYVSAGAYTAGPRVRGFGVDTNGWSDFYDTWIE
ncbi:ABC transporter substrate-binding protein [Nocardia sp. NPDC052566]|uniref:ABC transporter substrate-binding protein n=1 Tax=Nocardia sp. NPDC052566 TaxID=3364330 RepID=UPI0037C7883A